MTRRIDRAHLARAVKLFGRPELPPQGAMFNALCAAMPPLRGYPGERVLALSVRVLEALDRNGWQVARK